MGGGDAWSERVGTNVTTGLCYGFIYGSIRGALISNQIRLEGKQGWVPNHLSSIANIVARYSFQCALMGGLYSIGAAASASFRSKDDSLNYGVGGASAGAVAGTAV